MASMNRSGLGVLASSGAYAALQKYLTGRYANVVVLTFGEIEDLIGFPLPALARVQQDWWAAPVAGSPTSSQAQSWILSHRTAAPNLMAQTVLFERTTP